MAVSSVSQNYVTKKPANGTHLIRQGSPLPNISTLAILISPRKSPQIAKNGVPKMNFPELPGPRRSVEILQKP